MARKTQTLWVASSPTVGIVAYIVKGVPCPMVDDVGPDVADWVAKLQPIANAVGGPIEILRFDGPSVLRVVTPQDPSAN